MLLDVCKGFIEQYNVHKDIVEVIVTTPIEISEDIENSIQAYLNSIENGKIKLVKKRDESLIAGFTIDYNNSRLDASIKKKLEKMKKELKKTKDPVEALVDREIKPIIKKWIGKNLKSFVKTIVIQEMKLISQATQKHK